jgi:Tol biopolymer transport system component
MIKLRIVLGPVLLAGSLFPQTVPLRSIWRVEVLEPGRKVGRPARLISSPQGDWNPHFSPDGRKFVFESLRGETRQNWVAGSDGTNAFQLTWLEGCLAGTPRWSPDGRRIAFDATDGEIYLVAAAGGQSTNLTRHPARDVLPSWSRDSRRVYFCSNRGGPYDIWRMPANGGPAVRVTEDGGETAYESPDGSSVYYTKWGRETGLWRKNLEGGPEVKVLGSVVYRAFAVRKDGIYFLSKPEPHAGVLLCFLDLPSGEQRVLARLSEPLYNGFSVSPDGRYVIYSQVESADPIEPE